MINPNNITNVSFAASPALQALLNQRGQEIQPVGAPKPITTESYLVQNPITKPEAQTAVLEKTPKTDIYEPMHKKHDNGNGKRSEHKALKGAAAVLSIGAIIAAIVFSPKIAKALFKNVGEGIELTGIKKGFKNFADFIEKQENKIVQEYKQGGFVRTQLDKVSAQFKEGGAINKGFNYVKDAFKKDGIIGSIPQKISGHFSKGKAAETVQKAAETIAETV